MYDEEVIETYHVYLDGNQWYSVAFSDDYNLSTILKDVIASVDDELQKSGRRVKSSYVNLQINQLMLFSELKANTHWWEV